MDTIKILCPFFLKIGSSNKIESSRTGTASNSEEWSGVALPLVRRVFAEIAAKDFVSVQLYESSIWTCVLP